jgi:hypothetical protein
MVKANQNLAQRVFGLFLLLALITGSVTPAFSQTGRAPRLRRHVRTARRAAQPNYYTVAANTTIRVRMNETISSESARVGDRFTTTVVDPVYAGGKEVIPAGSTIVGRVTSVKRAARRKAGTISVHFVELRLPSGMSRAINADLTDLSNETANYDEEGRVTGRSTTKRNAVFIGGGAATGALIGAIAGGGRGAAAGAGVGAGLGVAGALLSKGHEAVVKRDTEFGVALNQSISLPAANVR